MACWKYGAAVQQRRGSVPLHEHHRAPRRALHPDVVDLELQIRQDARQALEPQAQGVPVVALAADRVDAAEAVMDSSG